MTARGRLVVFSAAERRHCEGLIASFLARHPAVELEFVAGISTALHERYLGGAVADLIWSSAMDQQMGLVLTGHAQPHGVAHGLPPRAAWRDLAVATTCEPLHTLSRDPDAPAGALAEVAALAAANLPLFRERVTLPDIEVNGLGFLAMLRARLEEPEFDRSLATLSACRPRVAGSAPALVASLAEGGALAMHLLGSYAERAVAADASLHIAPSASPAPAVSRIAFIPRRAENPGAGAAFLAHLLSPEGQVALGEAGLFPISAPLRRPVSPIPLDERFARLLDPDARRELLARWRAAVGRQATNEGEETSDEASPAAGEPARLRRPARAGPGTVG
jgi:iron(III) transport system substrate-binding protein